MKLVAPRIMNGTIAHWAIGSKAPALRGSGENPAVATEVRACATALYRSIRGASPESPSAQNTPAASAVTPMYSPQIRRAVCEIRGVSLSTRSICCSDCISWAPPTSSEDSTAVARMRIPSPPSHWMSWRHIMIDRECTEKSRSTVAPVVVSPLIDSNSAFSGDPIVPAPATTNGTAPTAAISSQISETARNASRGPSSVSGSPRIRRPPPRATAAAIATANGIGDSP